MFILELFFQFAYDISWDKSEPFTHCVMTDGDTNYKIKNKAKKSFMFKNSASVKKTTFNYVGIYILYIQMTIIIIMPSFLWKNKFSFCYQASVNILQLSLVKI